jgi:hypothetical protein
MDAYVLILTQCQTGNPPGKAEDSQLSILLFLLQKHSINLQITKASFPGKISLFFSAEFSRGPVPKNRRAVPAL